LAFSVGIAAFRSGNSGAWLAGRLDPWITRCCRDRWCRTAPGLSRRVHDWLPRVHPGGVPSPKVAIGYLGSCASSGCPGRCGRGLTSAVPRGSASTGRLLLWRVRRGLHSLLLSRRYPSGTLGHPLSGCCRPLDNLAGAGVVVCGVRRRRQSRALAGGDDAEFSAFAAREGGQLLGFAFLLVGNRHDAEDLVQQALLRTAARWPAPRQSPAGYSRTVLLNLVRDRWRAQQRQHAETLSPDLTAVPSVVDAAATVLDRQLLLRACRLLPLQQRAVLVLRFWEDRSVEETAAVLGCTAGTVKSHTHRALARLRDALADRGSAAPGGPAQEGRKTAC